MLIIRGSLRHIAPQIAAILEIVDEEFERVGCETTVLTSGYRDPKPGSLHHGYAADFDSEQMSEDWHDHKWVALKVSLKQRVGDEYDVVVHGPKAHCHVEFDPKFDNRLSVPV